MDTELQATTEAGRRFVALAEEHAADFATRAAQHDREGSFPHENIDALVDSGFMAGPIPEEFGGLGMTSLLDQAIGMSRLARGCASTAIAANMHISGARETARLWRWRDQMEQPPEMAGAIQMMLGGMGGKQIITCGPATEAGTDLASPMTEATRVDGGYEINGRKMFGTLSDAANIFFVTVRVKDGDGYLSSFAIVPKATPGVSVLGNWDAMGMRASGSHDVTFEHAVVPEASLLPPTPWGTLDSRFAEMSTSINFSLAVCTLGIAEAARDLAVELTSRRKGPRGKLLRERIPIQQLIAEIEIDLAAARAVVERTGRLADAHFARFAPGAAPAGEGHELLKQHQCMKYLLQRKAIDIVDKAMTVTGGSSYMSASPFSRFYRDVRAAPFMQPFAPYEALEYIGKVTLGLEPELDR